MEAPIWDYSSAATTDALRRHIVEQEIFIGYLKGKIEALNTDPVKVAKPGEFTELMDKFFGPGRSFSDRVCK